MVAGRRVEDEREKKKLRESKIKRIFLWLELGFWVERGDRKWDKLVPKLICSHTNCYNKSAL